MIIIIYQIMNFIEDILEFDNENCEAAGAVICFETLKVCLK